MEQSRVAHIDLGCFDLALLDVLKPRRQTPHHERAGQDIEVSASRLFVDTERSGELRTIPRLPVVVGDHGPETSERGWGDENAKQREITLQFQ